MDNKVEIWLKLIVLIDKANHRVKENEITEEVRNNFYKLKDEFLDFIVNKTPSFIELSFSYVPYFKYSRQTKDKAGDLMRKDFSKKPFEYYLSQIEPSNEDIEIIEKATIEVDINIQGLSFNFHIPYLKTTNWSININELEKKYWISTKEHNNILMSDLISQINYLLNSI